MKKLLWALPLLFMLLPHQAQAQNQTGTMIELGWVPSISPSATGVNVYRGTTSGAYTKISTISSVTAGFQDKTGTPGTKYFYVLRAFDSFGSESSNSNEASGTFPFPTAPLPPTSVTATPK